MHSLTLRLTTAAGDTLGELPLEGVAIAAPGEIQHSRSLGEMNRLLSLVQKALAAEGLRVAQDPLDFRIHLSRALLEEHQGAGITIDVPVREEGAGRPGHGEGSGAASGERGDLDLLEDLFDLDHLGEGGSDA